MAGSSMGIGADLPRVDGRAKLSGAAVYVDDLRLPDVLHGATVRSPVARGRIRAVHFDPAVDWTQYVIVDHRDIPGDNVVALIEDDQPVLAGGEVRHVHEPVVLIAHRSIRALRRALRAVRVDVDPAPYVTDPLQPLTADLIQFGPDNVFKRIDIHKGDPASVISSTARVIEGVYTTGAQEHVYLETQGMAAYFEGDTLVVTGSMQCPYYIVAALSRALGRPEDTLRVVQAAVGGGFGGKEDFPSQLAIHAALLATKAGAPVKIVYDRAEDLAVTTKRHPSRVRHRTAVDSDGRLLAMDIEVILDGGAYMTLSPVVLSRGALHAAGPYACDHVHVHGEARLTNTPPYGAFRGFGAPQTLFALERHMDEIAKALDMDPADLRRRNLLKHGQTLATGQVYREPTDLVDLMDQALKLADRDRRVRDHRAFNARNAYLKRGIGFATFFHGAGFTGAGEVHLASRVWVDGLPDGTVEVLTAQTDIGQGTTTILAQIAADRLGLPIDRIRVVQPDTSRVPNSGPTVASRTVMVVGELVARACEDLLRQLDTPPHGDPTARGPHDDPAAPGPSTHPRHDVAASDDARDLSRRIRSWYDRHPTDRLRGEATYRKPESIHWDEDAYRGDAYACYAWATHVAEVEVDLRTFIARVTDYVAVQEVGKVLNPTLARGQIQGGVAQGIGWALTEDVLLQDGAMRNAQMTNYIIPTSGDLPPIGVRFVENPCPYGPGGAKGIGELPADGPAPAIINAVCNALGTSIHAIPLTPERLMDHLCGTEPGSCPPNGQRRGRDGGDQ